MRLFLLINVVESFMPSDSSTCSNHTDSSSFYDEESMVMQALSTLVTQDGESLAEILKDISTQLDRQNKILIKIGRILGED